MAESGCKLEHTAASRIREQVLDGQWAKLEETLLDMKSHLKHQRHLQVCHVKLLNGLCIANQD